MSEPITIPCDLDAERFVLGTIMRYENAYHMVKAAMMPGLFYDRRHATIWAAIDELNQHGTPVDLHTVATNLFDQKAMERAGGALYVNEVSDHCVFGNVLESYLQRLHGVLGLRAVIELGQKMLQEAQTARPHHVDRILSKVMDRCVQIVRPMEGTGLIHVANDLDAIERSFVSDAPLAGVVPTGLPTLDRYSNGGLAPQRVTVIGAEAGGGKSTLMNTIATNAALAGKRTLIFSLEDSRQDWHRRTLARLAEVPYAAFLDPSMRTFEMAERVRKARPMLAACPLWAFDGADLASAQAVAMALAHRAEHGLDLVVVDHLIEFTDRADNSHMRITAAIRNMRRLAQEANIPVLVATQLNREGKLRESGSIEEVARAVWRLETDAPLSEDRNADHEQEVHRRLRIVKSNYGRKGTINLWSDFDQFYMCEWGFEHGPWTWRTNGSKAGNGPSVFPKPFGQ